VLPARRLESGCLQNARAIRVKAGENITVVCAARDAPKRSDGYITKDDGVFAIRDNTRDQDVRESIAGFKSEFRAIVCNRTTIR